VILKDKEERKKGVEARSVTSTKGGKEGIELHQERRENHPGISSRSNQGRESCLMHTSRRRRKRTSPLRRGGEEECRSRLDR